MSDFIYSKVTFAGESIEIMTPKHRPDAQHEHTLAYFEAFNDLRRHEADRVESFNDDAAETLRVPWKIYSRENPSGLTRGSKYMGNQRLWRPTLPIKMWKAPKSVTDKQAAINAAKIPEKIAAGEYVPVVHGGWPSRTEVTREMFMEEVDGS